jgi:phage terminase large subunit
MPRLRVNRCLEKFLTVSKPIKVAIGGRGSGKSIGIGDMFTMKMATEAADIYCLREFQDSVTDSVHKVFKGSIEDRLQLEDWDVQKNSVIAPNGASTTYKGANRNPDSMQSAQGYKYSWFEEAHRASQDSIDKLLPTILRNPGAECWFSANPQSSTDAFSQRFIAPYQAELDANGYYEDELHLIIVVNWRDNPWWNAEQEALRLWDFENMERARYDWVWEGKYNDEVEDAIIKPEWFDAAIDAHKKKGFEAEGVRVIGFDPADEGSDSKAIAYRHGVVIKKLSQWKTGDVEEATAIAYDTAFELRCTDFVYDGIGVGTAVKVSMKHKDAKGKIEICNFIGSESVRNPNDKYMDDRSNKDNFRNLRAQWYWYLRDRFEKTYQAVVKGKYIDPDELISIDSGCEYINVLKSELCKIRRKRGTSNTLVQIESKDEMRAHKLPSPNMADAVMMCFANLPPKPKKKALVIDTSYVV